MNVVRPSAEQASTYLKKWDSLDNIVPVENGLRKLFAETHPLNVDFFDVLIKVCVLNNLASLHIFSVSPVAKHIIKLNIDQRLANRDLTLVNDIAKVEFSGQKTKNLYSFATKYCSFHFPMDYPIYDSFVETMLVHFGEVDKFDKFKKAALRHYPTYHAVLMEFIRFYGLERFTLREVDMYLWLAGKEYFDNNTD